MAQQNIWRVIGKSVRGASHYRSGLPNQDAIRWLPEWGEGPPLILAVSDGHGSAKCFRSHLGSEMAVKIAVWLLQDLLDGQLEPSNFTAIKRTAEERLPREMVRRWRDMVALDVENSPFTAAELETLESKRDGMTRDKVVRHPELAYGATVLAVLVSRDFTLYFQLGDGDILNVNADGTVYRPMPEDKRLIANETTSLCMPDAWREVRFRFEVNSSEQPVMILVASDGYGNSYVNDSAFFKVGEDLLAMAREQGVSVIEAHLEDWLNEASKAGSGDDISLGIMYSAETLRTVADHTSDTVATDDEALLQDDSLLDMLEILAESKEAGAPRQKSGSGAKQQDKPLETSKRLPDFFVDA